MNERKIFALMSKLDKKEEIWPRRVTYSPSICVTHPHKKTKSKQNKNKKHSHSLSKNWSYGRFGVKLLVKKM